jgi:hypothetical protein
MRTYNITITPQDDPRIQTTVSVEVERSGRAVRVTEMTVRAVEGAGLPGARLPAVDVELLLRAILPPEAAEAAAEPEPRGRAGRAARITPGRAKRAAPEAREAKRTAPAARRAAAKAAKAAKAGEGDIRAYRRMPDDVVNTYAQLHSITALAAHYGVPRHTAQGWMNRLRKQGLALQ